MTTHEIDGELKKTLDSIAEFHDKNASAAAEHEAFQFITDLDERMEENGHCPDSVRRGGDLISRFFSWDSEDVDPITGHIPVKSLNYNDNHHDEVVDQIAREFLTGNNSIEQKADANEDGKLIQRFYYRQVRRLGRECDVTLFRVETTDGEEKGAVEYFVTHSTIVEVDHEAEEKRRLHMLALLKSIGGPAIQLAQAVQEAPATVQDTASRLKKAAQALLTIGKPE